MIIYFVCMNKHVDKMEAKQSKACWRKCVWYGMDGEVANVEKGELGTQKGGRGGTEGGRVRESQGEQACPLSHHAPGISYLKFSRSVPQKPFHTANKDAPGRTFQDALSHISLKEPPRKREWRENSRVEGGKTIKNIQLSLPIFKSTIHFTR